MPPDPQAYADVLVLAIKSALAPVVASLTALREQVATLERRVQDDTLTKALGDVRERIAVVEARPAPPAGPPGEPGPPGADGKDGAPGLEYVGVFQDGKTYEKGQVVTWAGSAWHCHAATTGKPGDGSKDWQLMVKHGRDAK